MNVAREKTTRNTPKHTSIVKLHFAEMKMRRMGQQQQQHKPIETTSSHIWSFAEQSQLLRWESCLPEIINHFEVVQRK